MASNVRVAVRVRPLSNKEKRLEVRNIITTNGNCISINNVKVEGHSEYGDSRERVKHFTFDYCYDQGSTTEDSAEAPSQELIYQDLGTEILQAAFEGYNACMFAYGQTGTGKTYTMMGYQNEIGIIPRICESMFSHIDDCSPEENITFKIEISYLEIYNERVRDLLQKPVKGRRDKYTLKIREHPQTGPYVQDLSKHVVKDYLEIQALIDRGNSARVTAATHMHKRSSRSHAIVTVSLSQAKFEDNLPSEIASKVHLVDLAGR
ncbi:hypothetical protein BsWGS_10053 [Bradybaena similaris]